MSNCAGEKSGNHPGVIGAIARLRLHYTSFLAWKEWEGAIARLRLHYTSFLAWKEWENSNKTLKLKVVLPVSELRTWCPLKRIIVNNCDQVASYKKYKWPTI
ncbi:hypothetical protein ACP275_14G054800 [Erythranthe tilingii]